MKLSPLFLLLTFGSFISLMSMDAPTLKRKEPDTPTQYEQPDDEQPNPTQDLIHLLEEFDAPQSPEEQQQILQNIQELLTQGADPNAQNEADEPLLFLANETRIPEIVQLLLKHGANPDTKDSQGNALLHEVTSDDIIRVLLHAGANPNIQDNAGNTPLYHAIRYTRINIVALLLRAGADPGIRNNKRQSALDMLAFKLEQTGKRNQAAHLQLLRIKQWLQDPKTLPKEGLEKIFSEKYKALGFD